MSVLVMIQLGVEIIGWFYFFLCVCLQHPTHHLQSSQITKFEICMLIIQLIMYCLFFLPYTHLTFTASVTIVLGGGI